MRFKLIIAFVEDTKTEDVIKTARENGATGATVLNNARGEGLNQKKTFLGLSLDIQRDMVFMVVEEHLSRTILEAIAEAGDFADGEDGQGIALQIDIEDVIGVTNQIESLTKVVEEKL